METSSTPSPRSQPGPQKVDRLYPIFYDELHSLAEKYMAKERVGHTLQPTALLHEAFIRIEKRGDEWSHRSQVMAVAAQAMRRVLIDHARGRRRQKRGGGAVQVSMQNVDIEVPQWGAGDDGAIDVLVLETALQKLQRSDPRKARVVELLYFGGLRVPEVAEVLSVTRRTVERDWNYARLWLLREVERIDAANEGTDESRGSPQADGSA